MTKYLFLMLILASCAQTKLAQKVDDEAGNQPPRPFAGQIANKGFEEIEQSKAFSEAQKKQLLDLHRKVIADSAKNREETSKLKGVLFETITASPYDKQKVEVIKEKLTKLHQEKLAIMLNALDETEKLLQVVSPQERRKIYDEFLKNHHIASE